MRLRSLLFAVFFFVFTLSMFGQSGDAQQPAGAAPEQTGQPAPGTGRFRARRQPTCWREAGISPGMVNQRWQIEDNAKAKISAICTDSSLSAEQRLAKIHEIHQETDAEIAKLIPEKQLSAFKACQAERDKQNASRAGKPAEKELGPCGGVIPSSGMSGHEHEH
jgi:hypothetical protein